MSTDSAAEPRSSRERSANGAERFASVLLTVTILLPAAGLAYGWYTSFFGGTASSGAAVAVIGTLVLIPLLAGMRLLSRLLWTGRGRYWTHGVTLVTYAVLSAYWVYGIGEMRGRESWQDDPGLLLPAAYVMLVCSIGVVAFTTWGAAIAHRAPPHGTASRRSSGVRDSPVR